MRNIFNLLIGCKKTVFLIFISVLISACTQNRVEEKKSDIYDQAHEVNQWIWPTSGIKIELNEKEPGIDIFGGYGQAILAAENGRVVYAGDALKGYKNLIVIRHSDIFLSAYANNNTILVKEGDIVLRGNKIATMGENASSAYLHFEIRKNGNSVDPRKFLPLNSMNNQPDTKSPSTNKE
ncbi:peptidoglycan DD-metalloendopeptidase family protein [Xenorhabdus griffiniae]|uniref:Peptidoglycan DD-metalloendopeptidase family protein n=1 Tax=Xenorhabdus griffiniae TaxID=351672 RepID=A0ABY9XF72_9GAMM|nr:peptidoglycan DD-metalloendopeptidase family protein [Xenorhabdus griffiniae]MBD1226658.1 peptidoglycan DD-metalloendopeptidase family protein [Xenorhabdus griffiniae]MBE8586156.1 peptidoglycan DD-metalloendopeptidase family protein [Xenorhabdus griffiniae]WMV71568.1 peptidoglycan DD-metalloendopeptidase family protein [Xenorhabdus griffiniae]WNH01245.1 peptidoglycan DD-metalloendopeptidase family protein [Xenorhabdus griffiniae]